MELRDVHYFIVIAAEQSVGRAARRLAVSPSTLYRRVKHLEAELGVTLLDRIDGDIRLSRAGAAFAEHCREIEREAALMRETMAMRAKGRRSAVHIGITGIAAELPAIANALITARAHLTTLDIRLVACSSEEQIRRVRQGSLDLGFVYTLSDSDNDMGHARLQHQRFVLAVAPDHRLVPAGPVRLKDLAEEDFVFQSRSISAENHDRLIAACSRAGLVPRIRHEIYDEDTQLAMVAAGMGVTLTLEGAALRRWQGRVCFVSVEDLDVAIALDLIWRRNDISDDTRNTVAAITAAASGRDPAQPYTP